MPTPSLSKIDISNFKKMNMLQIKIVSEHILWEHFFRFSHT